MATEIKNLESFKFDVNFINYLVAEQEFAKFLTNRTRSNFWDWYNAHIGKINAHYPNVDISGDTGVTKAVFVLPTTGTVIKIPFTNCLENYCELEWRNYQAAIMGGVSECFAWCEHLINVDGCPIYVMEYADVGEDNFIDTVHSYYPELAAEYSSDISCSDCVTEVLSCEWGEESYDDFSDFCGEWDINDIHGANVGWTDRGIVVVDYSGYHG